MKKIIILLSFIAAVFAQPAAAQTTPEMMLGTIKSMIDSAYLYYDQDLYDHAIALTDRVITAHPENPYGHYYRNYAVYRIFNTEPENQDYDLDEAIESFEPFQDDEVLGSEVKILLAGLTMMKLSSAVMEAPALSAKVHAYLDEAAEITPGNPRVHIIRGLMYFYTPAFFGGSYEKAEESFSAAAQLFENTQEADDLQPDWGRLESHAWIGLSRIQQENLEGALQAYKAALALNPEFGWVKYQLMPDLKNKMNKSE